MSRLKMMPADLRWVHSISFTKPRQVYCYFCGFVGKKNPSLRHCAVGHPQKAGFWENQAAVLRQSCC